MFDPDKWYVLTDHSGAHFDDVPNVTTYSWADEQVGFLAGVAAATTTETGIVGFVGAEPSADQEELRAGFEAGATSVDPDIEVVAAYLGAVRIRQQCTVRRTRRCPLRRRSALRRRGRRDLPRGGPLGRGGPRSGRLRTGGEPPLGDRGRQRRMADGEHPTPPPHPDVDRQAFRRTDLHGHRGPPRRRPRGRSAATHRRRRDDHLLPERRCVESRRPRRARPGDPATRLGRDPTAPPPDRSAHRAGLPRTRNGHRILRRCRSRSDRHVQLAGRLGSVDGGRVVVKSDADPTLDAGRDGVGVGFVDVDNVFADPCRARLADPPVGPTVDDLVTALADLPGDATTAIDVTVDGFDGKQIEFTVPDYTQDPDCVTLLPLAVRRQQRRPVPGWLGRTAPTSTTECGSSTSTAPGS